MRLVTHQTGPEGRVVRRLYVEQGLDIARELYVGLVVDREARRIAVMVSTEGGVEIEQVAEKSPEKIRTVHLDPHSACTPTRLGIWRSVGHRQGQPGSQENDAAVRFDARTPDPGVHRRGLLAM